MKTIRKAILLTAFVAALISCNVLAPKPREAPTPTDTSLPTSTSTPAPTLTATETPSPISPTETPSSSVLPLPSGKPASSWENIPIMPNAIAGEERSSGGTKSYTFTVEASAEEIQTFYETELAKLGWNRLAVGQGAEKNTLMIIFTKGSNILSLLVLPQPDGIILVMLVKE